MQVLAIEPHPDDLLLSTHFYIEKLLKEGNSISLLSISLTSSTFQYRSSFNYCREFGITYLDEPSIPQIFMTKAIDDLYVAKKDNKYLTANDIEQFYINSYIDIYYHIIQKIKFAITKIQPDIILAPRGMIHNTHILTRNAIDSVVRSNPIKIHTYYEFPYVTYPSAILWGVEPNKIKKAYPKRIQVKNELFKKFYPSETYMNLNCTTQEYLDISEQPLQKSDIRIESQKVFVFIQKN